MKLNKKTIFIGIIVFVLLTGGIFIFGKNNLSKISKANEVKEINYQNLKQATFKSEAISCAGCTAGIKYLVENSPGVVEVTTSFQEKTYTVVYDPKITNTKKIIQISGKEDSIVIEDKKYEK